MFMNLLKVALRNMRKKWLFTLINIVGLSTGIVCFFLIMINVRDEFSYDKFLKEGDRIYRLALERIYPANRIFYAIIPYSIGDAVTSDIPEVERMTRVAAPGGSVILKYGDKAFEETKFLFVDPNFFQTFSIPLIQGTPGQVFSNQNSLVLTRTTAAKYFGKENPVGKYLTTPQDQFLVSGVCENPPANSHIEFELLASIGVTGMDKNPNYISFSVHTYVVLRKGATPRSIEDRMPTLVEKYAAGQIQQHTGQSFKAYTAAGNGYRYFLQPVRDIHLHSHLESEMRANGNIAYVYILIAIAAFLIVIACINFMNLATARSTARAREVGIRKIAGTTRGSLIRQFLFESLLTSFLSVAAAAVLAKLLIPVFNQLTQKRLEVQFLRDPFQAALLLSLGLVVGLLAGLYPAFVLSSFRPVTVLKGRFTASRMGIRFRNALVVLQFVISIVCISMTLLVYRQLTFMRNKDLGFKPADVMVVERTYFLQKRGEAFKQEVLRLPGVVSGTGSNTFVSGGYYFGVMFQTEKSPEVKTTRGMVIDEDFVGTLGLTITEGRGFSREFNDVRNVIINESAVKEFGWTNPINMKIRRAGGADEPTGEYTIVGVVKDFHYNSLHSPINSFVYFCYDTRERTFTDLSLRIRPESRAATVAAVGTIWKSFSSGDPFKYVFLEDKLNAMYGNERTSGRIFSLFSLLAIVIACIGLFGLSAYMTEMRTKEIGVRKILGSTPSKIVVLLSRDFAKLVILALLVAVPVAYYAMARWLQNFAYRTDVSLWIFLAAGLVALFIEQSAISFQALKAAYTNPADALRFE
jgi:putative ABC transport system permease protein